MDSNQQNILITLSTCIQEFGAIQYLIHHIYRHHASQLNNSSSTVNYQKEQNDINCNQWHITFIHS